MSDPLAEEYRRQGDELRAEKRTTRAQRERLDEYVARDGIKDALDAAGAEADTDNLAAFLRGSNFRVVDDKPLVDVEGITTTPREAVDVMQAKPQKYGNLFYREKPREKTPQEKHTDKLRKMTDTQFKAYRQRRGPDYMMPESD